MLCFAEAVIVIALSTIDFGNYVHIRVRLIKLLRRGCAGRARARAQGGTQFQLHARSFIRDGCCRVPKSSEGNNIGLRSRPQERAHVD